MSMKTSILWFVKMCRWYFVSNMAPSIVALFTIIKIYMNTAIDTSSLRVTPSIAGGHHTQCEANHSQSTFMCSLWQHASRVMDPVSQRCYNHTLFYTRDLEETETPQQWKLRLSVNHPSTSGLGHIRVNV